MAAQQRSLGILLLLFCFFPVLTKGEATSDLAAVQEAYFKWLEEQAPELSTRVGNKENNDRLKDLSLEVFYPQLVAVQQFINSTLAIDRGQLSRQRQYSYDIFLNALTTFANNYRWRYYGPLGPINVRGAFYQARDFITRTTPFDTKKDFEDYLARLEARPAQINQMMDRMNKAIEMGTTYHNVSVSAVPGQISREINKEPQHSVFYSPFNATLDSLDISQDEKLALRSRAVDALNDIWDALRQLKTYFEDTYMPNTRTTYGVWGLPSGRDYYRACLQWHLSVNMTPEAVHQTGLREVDRITQLMRQVMNKQSFKGTINEYYNQLKTDPRFKLNSSEEIIAAYENIISNRINPKLPQLFKDIPPSRIEVRALEFDGNARYRYGSEDGSQPGIFYVNVMRPRDTNTFSMMALSLHESSPGHHLQSIYMMQSDLPMSQKYFDSAHYYDAPYKFPHYTSFGEGWGLYAEYLGEEMGVYADEYEMMGRYGDEIFRACRLVVDTGLHYKGWSRDQAIQYLSQRIPSTQAMIEKQIDRYITKPGQACAYKIGELKIKELRQKAEKELGPKFDIRQFHWVLLNNGRMPLSVMETVVMDYIADVKGGTSGAA